MKKDLIYRQRYLDTVRPFIGKQLIKVFTGQRRVGKSYLLFQIMQEIRSANEHAPIIYINKEDLAFSHLKKRAVGKIMFLLMKFKKSKILKLRCAHCCWMTNWIYIAPAATPTCFHAILPAP